MSTRLVKSWRGLHKQRKFFDTLAKKLNLSSLDDWYNLNTRQIRTSGGYGLLKTYSSSLVLALISAYPEHDWKTWKFKVGVPQGFWKEKYNRRSFFECLARELGSTSFSCWYRVSRSDIKKFGGAGLLSHYYNDSIYKAVKDVYAEYPWIPFLFNYVPKNFWSDLENHRWFLQYIGKELGFLDHVDYYKLRFNDLLAHGGYRLAQLYRKSPYLCLKSVFSEFNWSAGKFSKSPRRLVAPRSFDHFVFKNISVKNPSDWYRMPLSKFKKFGIQDRAELIRRLREVYPEFNWNERSFGNGKIVQWKLRRLLEEILGLKSPDISVLEDYWGLDGKTELDIFVPLLNLAFEYQGLQHFRDHYFFGPSMDYKIRDQKKRVACKRVGITLIEVPYDVWLDEVYVANLVRLSRPDIIG